MRRTRRTAVADLHADDGMDVAAAAAAAAAEPLAERRPSSTRRAARFKSNASDEEKERDPEADENVEVRAVEEAAATPRVPTRARKASKSRGGAGVEEGMDAVAVAAGGGGEGSADSKAVEIEVSVKLSTPEHIEAIHATTNLSMHITKYNSNSYSKHNRIIITSSIP